MAGGTALYGPEYSFFMSHSLYCASEKGLDKERWLPSGVAKFYDEITRYRRNFFISVLS